jgi:MFS family permease
VTQVASNTLPVASLAAVIGGLTVVAITAGFNAPLFSTRLDAMGYSDQLIGINAAANSIAPFIMAPLAPLILARFGLARVMIISGLLEAILFLACIAVPGFWGWTMIRLLMGFIAGVSWVAGEVWITQAATDATRGRVLAIYNSSFGIGTAAGPVLLTWAGYAGAAPFLLAAVLLAVSVLPILWARHLAPAMHDDGNRPSVRLLVVPLRRAPVPMILNLSYAMVFVAIWTFLPVYAVDTGYSVDQAYLQLSVFAVGSIVLQFPIGWLVDRGNRRLTGLALLTTTLLAVAALEVFVQWPILGFAYFFILGGISSGLYVVALTMIGARFRGPALAGAVTIYTLMWSLGALIGPPIVGEINAHLGAAGLTVSLVLFTAVFVPFVARDWWRNRVEHTAPNT